MKKHHFKKGQGNKATLYNYEDASLGLKGAHLRQNEGKTENPM
jgi:hypothetical protein